MLWQTRTRTFDFSRKGAIMGVLNVTPDSFSDGGLCVETADALLRAKAMIAEGAEIIDIGGESTRPGATPVPLAEELRRVIPAVQAVSALPGHGVNFVISIDTMKPEVAQAAMGVGASVINDVSGFRNPGMLTVAKETGAGVVIMHMQGTPQDMQKAPAYDNVVSDVRDFFCRAVENCVHSGVSVPQIALDPGIGFGKTVEHNLELLRRLPELVAPCPHVPLLLGVSRKSFLGKISGSAAIGERYWPTVAVTCYGRQRGARIFRVHDVKSNREALQMTEAIMEG